MRQGPWAGLLGLVAWLHLAAQGQCLVGPGQLCLASCLQDHLVGPGQWDQAAWEEVSGAIASVCLFSTTASLSQLCR